MKKATLSTIASIAQADETIPAEHREAILEACRTPEKPPRPEPGTIKDVAQILGIHPVTARRWAKQGMFRPIRLTARRVRYDLNEVRRLSSEGVEVEPSGSQKGISC